ncbi:MULTISPECIES: DUF485 domain-containing protein [unclassified Nocardiopsis]|uniref:DUF485 domain-containing protein n=1 Tax=unclassified Nocardiopsis TaxID=2649073 RepID=UPI00066C645F|nr:MULTISPECIES: DUF485 domain-containing protein [unclassified Nocardiopsis]MBQ1081326.1 DUF485 domain-containing protein [Nocardiopsis sp. B62]
MVEYMEGTSRRLGGGSGESPRANGTGSARGRTEADMAHACERMSVDPRFVKLRRRFALQVGFLVGAFLLSYLSHLLLSVYARDFMSVRIIDPVNVALATGIGQFLLTFVLAWAFGRFSARSIDPLAEEILERARAEDTLDGRVAG